jgi:ribonuclease Z
MAQLTILGSAAAIPDAFRENTYMVLKGEESSLLIDCAGSPLQRLQKAGVALESLKTLIVTHHHPDHVYGVPALFLGLWLSGQSGLRVFGSPDCVARIPAMMDLLEWQRWPTPFAVSFHKVEMRESCPVLGSDDFEITASPVKHLIPTIALRVVSRKTGGVLAYSSDTEPCESLFQLARGADILIHESTGPYPGHSTSAQAGIMARRCGVKKLVLIHFPALNGNLDNMVRAAEAEFDGPVELAQDFAVYTF